MANGQKLSGLAALGAGLATENPALAISGGLALLGGSGGESEQQKLARLARQRYNSIYGTTEHRLATFFNSLTPDQLAAQGATELKVKFNAAREKLNRDFAAAGLQGSGFQAHALTQSSLAEAVSLAKNNTNAQFEVAKQQEAFLGKGGSLDANALNIAGDAATNADTINQAQLKANSTSVATSLDALNPFFKSLLKDKNTQDSNAVS